MIVYITLYHIKAYLFRVFLIDAVILINDQF